MNRGKIVSAERRLLVCCAFLVFLASSATADSTSTPPSIEPGRVRDQ
jgi:hypothetical protein